jgi:hypothetical protein
MPFDVIGFAEATPGTGLVNLAAALGDNLYKYDGDDIILKKESNFLLGAFCAAVSTGDNYRFRQPSLMTDHQLIKIMLEADLDPSQGYEHFFGRPLPLVGGEKLNALIQNATDESSIIGAIVGNAPISRSMLDNVRPTHSIIGDGDQTLTANTWTHCAITWDQDLPKGDYAIVGMRLGYWITSGPLALLGRIVIPGNNDWRPGCPGSLMEADHEEFQSIPYAPFYQWPLMSKIRFPHTNMPNIECLSNAAITDETVELLLQKVA